MKPLASQVPGRASTDLRGPSPDRHAIVVSFAKLAGNTPISPRVQRTAHLTAALEREFEFGVTRVPEDLDRADLARGLVPTGLARKALRPLLLDQIEIPARVVMRGWQPSGEGALLIGWPYSPIYVAASRFVAAGVPYVVDVGDPWVLTEPRPSPWPRRLSLLRAKAAERFLWSHAAAGVVTTETQARGLRALFPDLELLVRPNGYLAADQPGVRKTSGPGSADGELRLVHFGSINSSRAPIGEWLSALPGATGFRRVLFANYGPVAHPERVRARHPAVTFEAHDPVDWERACQIARSFDAAVVVGNTDPAKLPSKAIQYLNLPIPRVALTVGGVSGELAAFAGQRPGFIAVGLDSPEDIPRLIAHVRRAWSDRELSPPAGDGWAEVAREVAQFAIRAWEGTGASRARDRAEPVATV